MIELLVVISLITLLIATLLPSVRRSMDVAAATLCKNNLREIGTSMMLYRIDNDGWLPSAKESIDSLHGTGRNGPWFGRLFPTYLSEPSILTCPEDPFGFRMKGVDASLKDPKVGEYASYGANTFAMTIVNGGSLDPDRLRPTRPHNTILAADMGPDGGRATSKKDDGKGPTRNASMLAWDGGYDPFAPSRPPNPWVTMRHGSGINMLTIAGGVREVVTRSVIREKLQPYYDRCASGGCTFCAYRAKHYSFARDQLYWWTGPSPIE